MSEKRTISEILNAVYIHGKREGDLPGSRMDIPALPPDELTIATAEKLMNQIVSDLQARVRELEENARYGVGLGGLINHADKIAQQEAQIALLREALEKITGYRPVQVGGLLWPNMDPVFIAREALSK